MADIRFITAPIGGGKSLFGVIQICDELARTERGVVTNNSLILRNAPKDYECLQDWCQKWIKNPVDISRRVLVLTEEQTKEWWRYVPMTYYTEKDIEGEETFVNDFGFIKCQGIKLKNVPHAMFGEVPDFTWRKNHPNGIYYQIDEAHQLFPSRYWQTTGAQVERYMSQLRKLNDDLDLITQHPEKVDKNFRRNATCWMQVQNMGRASLFMGVSLPKRFRWHWYNQPEQPQRMDKPTASGWYRVDAKKRQEFLYKTMDGVGVSGGMVKESMRHKGRSPFVWLLAALAVVAIAYALPRVLQSVITTAVAHGVKGVQAGFQNGASGLGVAAPGPAIKPPEMPNPEKLKAMQEAAQKVRSMTVASGLACNGVVMFDDKCRIFLTDGRVAYSERGEVQDVGERYVRVFGDPQKIARK